MTVYTVFTGGTISCSAKGGVLSPDNKNGYLLLDLAKQAGVKAAFVTAQPYTILSENLGAAHLQALRECLQAAIDSGYDRIIVTHGTDTLAYTAAYLDLTLGNSGAAIVLVSANYPLADERSNGLPNFLAAAQFLTTGERGVFVAYRNAGEAAIAIHRGSRVLPHTPYDDRVFSLFDMPFGTVCDGVFTRNPGYSECNREDFFDIFLSGLKVKVQLMKRYPDLSLFQLKAYYEKDKELRGEINKLIGEYSGYETQAQMLKLDKSRFAEGLDLKMMYTDMYLASQGYLWEKLQGGKIDPDRMEKDLTALAEFWRKVYSRK